LDGTNDREVARIHNTGDARTDAYLDQLHDLTTAWSRGQRSAIGAHTMGRTLESRIASALAATDITSSVGEYLATRTALATDAPDAEGTV